MLSNMNMNNSTTSAMPSSKVPALKKQDIAAAAKRLQWNRQLPKWTVIVDGRELPARPLVLEAASVPPNDPTNSHQAVEILRRLGFETRYTREQSEIRTNEKEESPETGEGLGSILEIGSAATKEVPEDDVDRVPDDLSINVDHYLYGSKKTGK